MLFQASCLETHSLKILEHTRIMKKNLELTRKLTLFDAF